MKSIASVSAFLALLAAPQSLFLANAATLAGRSNHGDSKVWTLADSYLGDSSETPPNSSLPKPPSEVDVVIVGGGFSGLMSASELQKAGLKTVLLEAKGAIGGRSRSVKRKSGEGVIELGATWINNKTQPVIFGLTEQFGLEVAEQFTDGESLFQGSDGKVEKLPAGYILSTQDPEGAKLEGDLISLMIEAQDKINIRKFDDFPLEDDVSFEDWVTKRGLWENDHVRAVARQATAAIVGREPHEVGAHYFLDYVKSGNGIISLSTEGTDGAQSLKVKQGTTSIAVNLAKNLTPGSVLINTPVKSIKQHNGITKVTAANGKTFKTKKVILAIPTNTYADITFSPPLPCKKTALFSKTKPGIYAKLILSYAKPWWRDAGLVGKFSSAVGPVSFSWDTSDLKKEQYSLAIFIAGDIAARWYELPDEEKESSVVEHLASLVGKDLEDNARDVLEINSALWVREDYIYGAPTNSMGPGVLRKYGRVLREPFGSLHFGGGETAYEWKGYLEGALRAGQRAADEVIDELGACET